MFKDNFGLPTILCVVAGVCPLSSSYATEQDQIERGRYLVSIMDCTGCHTRGALAGQPDPKGFLAGSDIGFGGPPPAGAVTDPVVYPPNLTPDPETGLGSWSDDEILAAVRAGRGKNGRPLLAIMPWPAYANLSEEDGRALVAYLRAIPTVMHRVPTPVAPGESAVSPYLTMVVPSKG